MPDTNEAVTPVTPEATPVAEASKASETPVKTTQEKVAEEIKKWKLKVDGADVEVDEQELITRAQKATAAEKRMQEAAELKKQVEALAQVLDEKPIAYLEELLGADRVRSMLEDHLASKVKEELMDPKEREVHEKLKELDALKEKEKERAEAERQAELTALEAKFTESFTKDIQDTLVKSGIPATPATMRLTASYMKQLLDQGAEPKASDVMDSVKAEYESMLRDIFNTYDGDRLLTILGDDTLKKVRKADLDRVNKKGLAPAGSPPNSAVGDRNNTKKVKTMEEWQEEIAKKKLA